MFKKTTYIIIISLVVVLLGSCNRFTKLQKKGTPEEKYNASMVYYEKGDYYHALQLFDELIVLYRGTRKSEKIYYLYAMSYYKERDYILASYHFKFFAKTFPRSPFAEECMYLSAYCKYLDSPKYSLDQSSTEAAIREMQQYINTYPDSEKVEEANKVMDELRLKLIRKDFNSAKEYLKTEYYRAAIYSLNQHIKDFPSSPFLEECTYLIIKANNIYAKKSIFSRQEERYNLAIAAFNDYQAKYPDGRYMKDAKKLLHSSNKGIVKVERFRKRRHRVL
ncbi:MAG: outer membrane protein assembly factor BamD [Bacteroidales bacterium]|nr:outer membrane protein assembly factor BamD [Bacteroidales bacterium]